MKLYDSIELAGRNLRESVLRNSLTTLGYPRGNLAFRWFLADDVPARPDARVMKLSEAPTQSD